MRDYDATAYLYDRRYAEEQTAKYEAVLDNLDIKKHDAVLDVGCGTGLLFSHVANRAGTIVGVDISGKILLYAKKRAKQFSDVHLVMADADYLPFKNNVFNCAFAITVLQNMPKPEKTLKEIKRVITENAVVIISALKKKFLLIDFEALLSRLGLKSVEIKERDLQCYMAVCMNKTS
jgi:ubiquinone/menaquinone biosynthesis C-methylase UbiE